MSGNLVSLAGWYLLPNLVTGWAQTAYYAIWIRAGEPKPQPGSRAFVTHRKRIHILVILAYLLYTIYEADWQLRQEGDLYNDLGVRHDVEDRGLQSRFRRLTVTYHPDKVSSPEARPAAELYYVHLKLCRDILIDPAKRFAYDRFGPAIIHWRHCTTIRDYIMAGVQNTAYYYFGTGAVLVVLGVVGYMQHAPFWRFLALAALFMFEIYTMTRPTVPSILTKAINPLVSTFTTRQPYLPFQALGLARKLTLTFFIALSQIGPVLQSPLSSQGNGAQIQGQQLDRMDMDLRTADQEVSRLLGLELTPYAADESTMNELRSSMRRWLVDNTVRSNAEVRTAIGRVLERRRAGVPAGAQGAR
ncbi:hypothetical protein MBLNU459_g6669t1 [Dothideomycetes sp. NU459]